VEADHVASGLEHGGHPFARRDVMANGQPRTTLGDADSVHVQSVPSERGNEGSGYHRANRRCRVTVWFTVKLADRPGSLARVATALGERGVNITGIVGVAEDTDGALMLTTSDAAATREAFSALDLAFEEHDPTGGVEPGALSVNDLRPGAAGRGSPG
jgi:hypothetical protein